MANDNTNRVLSRQTARELTQREIEGVGGAVRTLTKCSFDENFGRDGDVGEC